MRDPHVESLEYVLKTADSLKFEGAPPLEHEVAICRLRLADGHLVVAMKQHCSTEIEARENVEPLLRAWELDFALQRRRREAWFEFTGAKLIDRDPPPPPPPGVPLVVEIRSTLGGVASVGFGTATTKRSVYPSAARRTHRDA